MRKSKIINALCQVVVENEIDKKLDKQAISIATALYSHLEILLWMDTQPKAMLFEQAQLEQKAENDKAKEEEAIVNEFVDKMYALYPTKCPKRNCSLGKSKRDKTRIKALLKTYTPEQIEQVIRHEVDSNYGVNYMKNFSTFLNNFPEPVENITTDFAQTNGKNQDVMVINGQIYK